MPSRLLGGRVAYLVTAAVLLFGGMGLYAYLINSGPEPADGSPEVPARLVRVFEARRAAHQVAITAYGTSRAAEVWTAIAEVRGRVVEVNSRFEVGELLPAGTLLVRIDRADYLSAHDRFAAETEAKQLQIEELNRNEEHLKRILTLQERQFELVEAEYERLRRMYERDVTSVSTLEAAENALLSQQTALQTTRNNLSLISVQRLELEALLKAAKAQLEQATRDLARCEIRLPLDARCVSKSIEAVQFVAMGERLGTFLTLDAAEVVAMVETGKLAALMDSGNSRRDPINLRTIEPRILAETFRIPVEVRWSLGDRTVSWLGRVTRIGSALDPNTRTAPLIVEVRDPYANIQPGVRPPLLPDAFCEITAYGPTVHDVVVIPRDALHEGKVYVLCRESSPEDPVPPSSNSTSDSLKTPDYIAGNLEKRPVKIRAFEEDLVVIEEGLAPGDLVILSDVPQADVLGDSLAAFGGLPLRGELVENPVKARPTVEVPADLFDDSDRDHRAEQPADGFGQGAIDGFSSSLKKGATAGLPSSALGFPRGNTAGQASSGTRRPRIRLVQRAVSPGPIDGFSPGTFTPGAIDAPSITPQPEART